MAKISVNVAINKNRGQELFHKRENHAVNINLCVQFVIQRVKSGFFQIMSIERNSFTARNQTLRCYRVYISYHKLLFKQNQRNDVDNVLPKKLCHKKVVHLGCHEAPCSVTIRRLVAVIPLLYLLYFKYLGALTVRGNFVYCLSSPTYCWLHITQIATEIPQFLQVRF